MRTVISRRFNGSRDKSQSGDAPPVPEQIKGEDRGQHPAADSSGNAVQPLGQGTGCVGKQKLSFFQQGFLHLLIQCDAVPAEPFFALTQKVPDLAVQPRQGRADLPRLPCQRRDQHEKKQPQSCAESRHGQRGRPTAGKPSFQPAHQRKRASMTRRPRNNWRIMLEKSVHCQRIKAPDRMPQAQRFQYFP